MMAFEFSVTMLTSAGLVEGVEDDADWITQSLWMLLGIPFSIAFFSELSAYVWHVAKHHRHRRHHSVGVSRPLIDPSSTSMPATEYIYLERLARASGYLRDLDSVPDSTEALDDLQATLQVPELMLSVIVWWTAGTLFYYLYEGFALVYAFYYSINVGLGIGNCPYQPSRTWSRLYTIFHCIIGSSLIYGGVSTVFKEATERLRKKRDDDDVSTASSCSEDDETEEAQLGRVYIYGCIYVGCLVLGIPVAWVCGYSNPIDIIEFTVTYMTTTGLLSFDREYSHGPIYFVSACYIALAIPIAAVFISELASEAFVHREHQVVTERIRESEDAVAGFAPPPPPSPQKKARVRVPSAYARFLRGVRSRAGFREASPERRPEA